MGQKHVVSVIATVMRKLRRSTRKLAQCVAKKHKGECRENKGINGKQPSDKKTKNLYQTNAGKAVKVFCNGDQLGFRQ